MTVISVIKKVDGLLAKVFTFLAQSAKTSTMDTFPTPQRLSAVENDCYRVLIVRNLAWLEIHRSKTSTKIVLIEEAWQILTRLSGVYQLTTEDRDVIDEIMQHLALVGVPVTKKVNI